MFAVFPSKCRRILTSALLSPPSSACNSHIDFKTRFDEEATTGKECIYRMPVYADEPRRLQYKFYSWLSNYAISNPLSQVYFMGHAFIFNKYSAISSYIESIHRQLGFRQGAKEWAKYAAKQARRARWAENLYNGDNDIEDLGEMTSKGKKAKKKQIVPKGMLGNVVESATGKGDKDASASGTGTAIPIIFQ